ncbi:MAG: TetR/AcrR family transcriptional regulator [Acidimicrobiales bacterium]|nr:TetR/AcrR family transcriptional regulator [Acidimicrobiales bacterium]
MPRITSRTIAEHVARQEEAVVRAAVRLFAERGFAAVTMADIAGEVGLARNSLYRYFPDKDHILLVWLRRETQQLIEQSEQIAASDRAPRARLRDWLRLQFEYLTDPEHRLFTSITSTLGTLDPEVMQEVSEQHRRLYATLEPIVADALAGSDRTRRADRPTATGRRSGRDPVLVAQLLVGLVRAAGEAVDGGVRRSVVLRELERAALGVISAGSALER